MMNFNEREKLLHEYKGEDRVITSQEMLEELAKVDDTVFTTKTGVESLDRILNGVEAGELIVVTGPSGQGKTTLLMSITKNMAEAKNRGLWFTLEVTPRQFMKKMQQMGSSDAVPLFYIPRNPLENVAPEYITAWEKKMGRKYQMIDWVEDKIIETKAKYESEGERLRCVFIDHIHMLFSVSQMEGVSLSLEIGDMVSKIKKMALDHNVTVFLIAHCKDDPNGTAREPRMSDIRDSGMIIRLSDTVIGVWRIPNDKNVADIHKLMPLAETDTQAKVVVFKNRREGPLGFFGMQHKNHYLEEVTFGDL